MKRKLIPIFLTLIFVIGAFAAFGVFVGAEGADGDHVIGDDLLCTLCGNYDAPVLNDYDIYVIKNASELMWFRNEVNSGNGMITAHLDCDIDLGGIPWTPIGTKENPFRGFFSGSNHKISGLNVKAYEDGAGLFGYIDTSNSTATNTGIAFLTLEGEITVFENDLKYIGGIAGKAVSTNFLKCHSYVNVDQIDEVTGTLHVGGIVGYACSELADEKTSITSSSYYGNIELESASGNIGGIAGTADGYVKINNSGSYGNVIADAASAVGGILGASVSANVEGPYSCLNLSGLFTATGEHGAIAGSLTNYKEDTVKNNYYLDLTASVGFAHDEKGNASAISKTIEEFRSGEVTYLLNENGKNYYWLQEIDTYKPCECPHNQGGSTLYLKPSCDGTGEAYTNNQNKQPHISHDTTECINCGEELFVVVDGIAYYDGGDVSKSDISLPDHADYNKVYFKAGEGIILLTREDVTISELRDEPYKGMAVLSMNNATIDLRDTAYNIAIFHEYDLKIVFNGENNIYSNTAGILLSGQDPDTAILAFAGAEDASLNIYGKGEDGTPFRGFEGGRVIHEKGTVSVIGDNTETAANSFLLLKEDAALNVTGGYLLAGISLSETYKEKGFKSVMSSGELNAAVEEFVITAEESADSYIQRVYATVTSYGKATYPLNLATDFNHPSIILTTDLVITEGSVLTVPREAKLDLMSLASVTNNGRIEGDYVCSHIGGSYSCTVGYICDLCHTEYTEAPGHKTEPWVWNELGHYRSCINCTDYTESAKHEYTVPESRNDHFHEKECIVCKYAVSEEHVFTYEDLGQTHKVTCGGCDYSSTSHHYTREQIYTEKDQDLHAYVCSECKFTIEENHNFGLFEKIDGERHKKYCYNCNFELVEAHTFSFYQPIIPGDCLNQGTLLALCDTFCGAEHSIPDEDTGNGHDWELEETTPPTCSEKGKNHYVCDDDPSHTYTEEIDIDGDAHSWDEGSLTKEPTCSDFGAYTFTCIHNGEHTYTVDVQADENAHAWNGGVLTKAQTCTESGTKTYVCLHNGAHAYEETISAIGHTYSGKCDTGCNLCKEPREAEPHTDADGDRICDVCADELPSEAPSGRVIAGIAVGSAAAIGVVGFFFLFVIKKKKYI